ncbi:unnamed protein product [Microthlaspi erraticum]|uniref:NB-ARC domain-containing protein n=1 Tax=Microthlaspi erraticum TaxID=1685480 RepID=A0A6D2HHD4_9BRAS|nr:unnamed protein product [Microthlaspi erraticum]
MWIVVSQGLSSGKVIDDIGEKLGLCGEEWHRRNERENSVQIYNLLKTRRFVLLLDDLWKKVNLSEIGVPHPSRENGCKIAFTTRSLDVCGQMGVDRKLVEAQRLNWNWGY